MDLRENKQHYTSAYKQLRPILSTEDIFHTFLVAMNKRPACIATIAIQNETNKPFCESPRRPETTRADAEKHLTAVLDELDVDYTMERKELRMKRVTSVYVSNTEQRVRKFDSQTEDDIEIGAFLGYPTDAINWYLDKDGRISDWKEWYLKFDAVHHHNRQPHFVEHYNYIEYIPAPTRQSYREAFAIADERASIANKLNQVCDTTAFTDIKYTTQRKPVAYGVLYALFRAVFEQNLDGN